MTDKPCAVRQDLRRHLAQMDEEARYEMACEQAAEEAFEDLITGARAVEDDDELREKLDQDIGYTDLIVALLAPREDTRNTHWHMLKTRVRDIIEQHANGLAPQIVKANREAAEENAAEAKLEARGLM